MQTKLKNYLEKNNIQYIKHEHPAVFTVEEATEHCAHIPGVASKNLFLRERKKDNFILVVMPAVKKMNITEFGKMIEIKNLTFAKPEEVEDILGLKSGSVSPFGLVNDTEAKVKLYIDEDLWYADTVSFHPNENTSTLEIKQEAFRAYVKSLKNQTKIILLNFE